MTIPGTLNPLVTLATKLFPLEVAPYFRSKTLENIPAKLYENGSFLLHLPDKLQQKTPSLGTLQGHVSVPLNDKGKTSGAMLPGVLCPHTRSVTEMRAEREWQIPHLKLGLSRQIVLLTTQQIT